MAPGTAVGSKKFKRCGGEKKVVVWWGKGFLDASESRNQDAELAVVMCLGGGQG